MKRLLIVILTSFLLLMLFSTLSLIPIRSESMEGELSLRLIQKRNPETKFFDSSNADKPMFDGAATVIDPNSTATVCSGVQPLLLLPFPTGTSHKNTQPAFGTCTHQATSQSTKHDLDLDTPNPPAPKEDVVASAPGIVYLHEDSGSCLVGGFGKHINLKHDDTYFTLYAHLSEFKVSSGQFVERGQLIAKSGCSGNCCGDHLHWGLHTGDPSVSATQSVSVNARNILARDVTANTPFRLFDSVEFIGGFYDQHGDLVCGPQDGHTYASNNTWCNGGYSESYRTQSCSLPEHPEGTAIRTRSDPNGTVYILRRNDTHMAGLHRDGIPTEQTLWTLYQNGGLGLQDVIAVEDGEMNSYLVGGTICQSGCSISSPLPSNGRSEPPGRLITNGSEVSIVQSDGGRRPFSSQLTFSQMGYLFCNVLPTSDYGWYLPVGQIVDGNPEDVGGSPDEFGPNLSITSHTNNQTVTNSTVTISGTASDAGRGESGIASVTVNGVRANGDTATGSNTSNWSRAITLNLGANTITVVASDNAPMPNQTTQTITLNLSGGGCPATSITVGQTRNGSLSSSDCVVPGTSRYRDVYSFSGVAGQGIAASMDSSVLDTYLYLTSPGGQILREDNNSGPGTNSRIPGTSGFFILPASGTYFLWASSASNSETGGYSISLSGCTYSLSTPDNEVGPGTGSTNIFMDAPSGCPWSAVSDSTSWLTTSSTGSGDGTVRYDFIANSSTSSRTGRITVGGQVHTVTQIGVGGAGSVQFSAALYSANEGGGSATITITRTGGTASGHVNYATSDGTATAGSDYAQASGLLIFSENQTSRSFDVTILDDTAFEGNESVNLSLTSASTSLTRGNPSTATLTIVDNDSSPTRTLTVASSDPSSGVSITVSPNDNNGQGGGVTQFSRVYNNNAVISLTAPSTAGGNNFQKWQRDGSDWTTSTSTSVNMDANHTMTAVYSSCAAPGAFSLISPGNGLNLAATNLVTLSWGNSPNANSYAVYFGTSSNPGFWSNVTATSLNVSVNVGQTYWWKVVARVGCSSSLTFATPIWSFSVNSVTPPNDNFANSQSISGNSGTVNGTNAGATKEAGEPNHANNTGGASIWYFWSAPADGYVTITTVGSNFDTLLAVYTNSSISNLTPIAGNDDIDSGNLASSVTFNTTAGTVYRIAVDGWAGAMGNTTLNWTFIPDTNRINVALASNGGVATASSTTPPDGTGTFFPSVAIDGDHKGLNTSFWRDDTGDTYPDWFQVDFAGSKTIHEIDVYTLQDNYTNPVEPSLNMSFNLYGITAFNVQYWSDFWGWVNVPGGSVTGNSNVWRRFTFADISTTKIRVLVNNALATRSRIVELEAYGVLAPTSAVNVALSSNGAMATASSTTPPDGTGTFLPSVAIDGDHKGLNTSFWRDGTGDSYPDWLQVDFAGSKTIHEIDVYTLQDDYTNPAEPSSATTFNLYGITALDVQYWNGSGWVIVPGGSVTGNNNVWRRFTFSDITTSKIRVLVNNALASRSRIVELEAYSLTAPNVASAANGGVASASSTTPPDGTGTFLPSVAIDGDHKGLNTSFWRDGTRESYPDWLQVDFAGNKTISEIDVYTLQDNYTNPSEPSAAMTFNLYGITGFEVQYWNGTSWVTVPGGSVIGNNNVWRKFTFSDITTSKIRVLVNNALASRSRIVELEAY